jgi:hypothetical protein
MSSRKNFFGGVQKNSAPDFRGLETSKIGFKGKKLFWVTIKKHAPFSKLTDTIPKKG